MRLLVAAVGRLKAGPEKSLADGYLMRAEAMGRKSGISRIAIAEFAESQASSAQSRMADETRAIAAALPPRAFSVVLDERGTAMTSRAFAGLLKKHLETGTPDVAFLIGGPDGHAPQTRERAGLLMSFGPMTWPHRLLRVMLFEQIYRAATILGGHPYHRV